MLALDIRRRSGVLFLVVVVAHIVVISAQVPVERLSQVSLLESVAFGVASELQQLAAAGTGGVRDAWRDYAALRGVRAENERLLRRLADLQVELQQQRALADRSRQLERLLDLRDRSHLRTAAAAVIGGGASPEFQAITIDKGSGDGLRRDMAVIAPEGVVGRVVIPATRAAKVQLVIDRNAAVAGLIERTRAQGVVLGVGADMLRMDFVADTSDLQSGDLVITSGLDGIYPKGLVIGRVELVERAGSGFRTIEIRPSVDFSTLEEVLVVLTPDPAREDGDGG